MRWLAPILAMIIAVPAHAQLVPQPGQDNPRIQQVHWVAGQDIVLTMLPMTAVTIALEPGELISQVSLDNDRAFDVRVSTERDSILLVPLVEAAAGAMTVQTGARVYRFRMQTGTGLLAAYLVQVTTANTRPELPVAAPAPMPVPTGEIWSYRLRGDRAVRPASVTDDGVRTRVEFTPEQSLPAIFAVGPTGDEQVVNGYMRGEVYVIDRVWQELVFRIDKEKATARRAREPVSSDG